MLARGRPDATGSDQHLYMQANAPIFQVDLSDNIVEWNTWLVNTTGLSRETVLGKHISSVLSPGSKKRFQDVSG